ncbi:MAG TPA: glutamate--tRNA ligase [Steroidobacteraceae bacterium]|nr:glutamate--tRNA ligase [Steroidobacteraceae bacterium]
MPSPVVTRFAPSPTGALHLGNVRTALFNWLYARRHGGRFVLRIEDTDRERSDETQVGALMAELAWLGLDWDAGPDREDAAGPYRQSARAERYAAGFARLEAAGRAYPCYCTPFELEVARRSQLAAGRPPRYPGTCAALGPAERAARAAEGRPATLRFRVTPGEVLSYEDLVRGPQRFASEELGDFVIRRADGSAAFLFSNALDDAAMGVSHVLRGEDHVANTPRQQLIVRALGAEPPRYGHLPLLVGPGGAPLSKRDGSAAVAGLRAEGYLPEAVLNLLARLGHSYATDGWLTRDELVAGFELGALGRAPAHFDRAQLRYWQKEAVHRAPAALLEGWARGRVPPGQEQAFVAAVRANLELPADAALWAHIVYGELPCADAGIRELIAGAGAAFYDAALAGHAARAVGGGYAALVSALKATGASGARLFKPLRAALTQRLDGPELEALLTVMPAATVRTRLEAALRLARHPDPSPGSPSR